MPIRSFLQLIRCIIFCFAITFFTCHGYGQTQLSIKNFAIFGGNSSAGITDSALSGVEFASNISVAGGGLVGTPTFFHANNHVTIAGDVYANTASIGNNFTINPGSLSVFNREGVVNATLNAGPQILLLFPGNININGSAVIASGTVNGLLTQPTGYDYDGPSPDLGTSHTAPVFPIMPELPELTTFTLSEDPVINSTQTIAPGEYDAIVLTGGQTLTFAGPGTYIFRAIQNTNKNTFQFDFQNNKTGGIKIYVQDDADLGNIDAVMINGGSASRIYTEVHGDGSSTSPATSFMMNTTDAVSSSWLGTVYAPNSTIRVGNNNVGSINVLTGCLWSDQKVTIGINTSFNFAPLSIAADPKPNTLILPYYPPPADGKINTAIGSELTSLFENGTSTVKDSIIYQTGHDSVLIEVVVLENKYAAALAFLQANGLTDIINNGSGSLVITGKFPIANLLSLNTQPDLIDYVRPLYYPLNNVGVVTSQGDTAMQSNLVKEGYKLTGEGVKVGVISDSYNTLPGNHAAIDVSNDDLPGNGNPHGYLLPVNVVGEYPYGQRTDEGRAMLQIVHDIAPKAQLAFRTGFVSAGDFAQGIGELDAAGCKVIVDDVTYITEPYFKDGVIAKAVDNAVANGATYFSAAGNFGKKSYEATFNDMVAPADIRGITDRVHNFGSSGAGNPYQTLNLTPGTYTIVLQWEDDIYSLGTRTASSGTQTDLDIFLVDKLGSTLFGFNRNNIGNDPIEVLPFTVKTATTANIIIGKAAGPNVKFKYIVFRGDLTFGNYNGSSTLVGQANAAGAIAVGAVLYSNTPPYGLATPTIASFSSVGGARVNGTTRNKPDITAPNGINTTVDFNSFDLEDDHFPNFYGTSAAAPHAAAAAALLIEGKQKFLGQTITPASLRSLLQTTAISMGTAGYDPVTGYGFINPFGAMQTFANPIPRIDSLITPGPLTRPVTTPFTVTVKGKGLNDDTKIYLRGEALSTKFVNNETVTAVIPPFTDNPAIQLYNPSKIDPALNNTFIDGGLSESIYFFSNNQKHIIVKADNKAKKYGEKLPAFTATITVDGVPIQNTGLTPADLKLNNLAYTTAASTSSNVATYFIHPVNPLDPSIPADALLLKQYSYEFIDGVLTIQKLPLKITPRDTTLTYGQKIHGIKFNYQLGASGTLQNPDSLVKAIQLSHTGAVLDSLYGLVSTRGATSRPLVNGDLNNMSILASKGSTTTSRTLINTASGTIEKSYIVDIDAMSIFNYKNDSASAPLVSTRGAKSRGLVNSGPLINGTANVIINTRGATSRGLVNGDPSLLNSNSTGGASNTNVAVIVSLEDVPAAAKNSITTKSINTVTGITAGIQTIVPGTFISENFEITYGLGKLTINKACLNIKENSTYTDNGILPKFTSGISGYQYQDAAIKPVSGPAYILVPSYKKAPGLYIVKPYALKFAGDSNYQKNYINGVLYVNPYDSKTKKVIIKIGCVEKVFNHPSGLKYVAHFSYENKNNIPVFVQIGANNFINSSGRYSGTQPELFLNGVHYFDIYFNGNTMKWTLKTLDGKSKTTTVVTCSYDKNKCKESNYGKNNVADNADDKENDTTHNSAQKASPRKIEIEQKASLVKDKEVLVENARVYPNPAIDKLMLASTTGFGDNKNIVVNDISGKTYYIGITKKSAQMIELNISALHSGMYYIRVKQNNNYKTLSFIKL